MAGWIGLDQARAAIEARAAGRVTPAFAEGKLRAACFFTETELPRIAIWLAAVRAQSGTAATMPVEAF